MEEALLLSHAFATFFMCGLIWLIQLVHYPSFRFVSEAQYAEFQRFHMQRISWIVAPVMLLELVTAGVLWINNRNAPWSINLLLLCLIWFSTVVIQTPVHSKLEKGFDEKLLQRLVRENWGRTLLWSARSVLLLSLLQLPPQ